MTLIRPFLPTLSALSAILLLAASGCARKQERHFGEPFSNAPLVPIADLLERPGDFYRKPVRVSGTIERQCPASGCWLFLRDAGGRTIRVELGDTFPTLPQFVGGQAEVEGEWVDRGGHFELIGTRITFRPAGAEEPKP